MGFTTTLLRAKNIASIASISVFFFFFLSTCEDKGSYAFLNSSTSHLKSDAQARFKCASDI